MCGGETAVVRKGHHEEGKGNENEAEDPRCDATGVARRGTGFGLALLLLLGFWKAKDRQNQLETCFSFV